MRYCDSDYEEQMAASMSTKTAGTASDDSLDSTSATPEQKVENCWYCKQDGHTYRTCGLLIEHADRLDRSASSSSSSTQQASNTSGCSRCYGERVQHMPCHTRGDHADAEIW